MVSGSKQKPISTRPLPEPAPGALIPSSPVIGCVEPVAARALTDAGRETVEWLAALGAPFDRNADGGFVVSLEAAHSVPRVARVGGSWRFIIAFAVFLVAWMALNSAMGRAFDPYPFILLNLVLSCLAALQAPVIMMSQNRQAEADRMQAQNDYEVNIKSELEILQVHEKLNELRERDWAALVELQNRQIEMLQQLLQQAAGAAPRPAQP